MPSSAGSTGPNGRSGVAGGGFVGAGHGSELRRIRRLARTLSAHIRIQGDHDARSRHPQRHGRRRHRGAGARGPTSAIDGDRVVAVGEVDGDGRRTIDADGCIVTPGFVDIHTHLDAQLAWDPIGILVVLARRHLGRARQLRRHVRPVQAEADREELAEMMESVEDIPADSIMSGLAWDWTDLRRVPRRGRALPKGINVGGMVGHCAVRVHAMGERSLERGAGHRRRHRRDVRTWSTRRSAPARSGFSTSRTLLHRVPDGRPVPGTWATSRRAASPSPRCMGRHGRGVFEAAPRARRARPAPTTQPTRAEVEMMADITIASGRPLTFGLRPELPPRRPVRQVLEFVERGQRRGRATSGRRPRRAASASSSGSRTTRRSTAPARGSGCGMLSLDEKLAVLARPAPSRMQLIEDGADRAGRRRS